MDHPINTMLRPDALCGLILLLASSALAGPAIINLPFSMRNEGRLTLNVVQDGQNYQHHFAFSEVIDARSKRSKVSIGYLSYEPLVYHTRGKTTMTVNSKGKCEVIQRKAEGELEAKLSFVPELDWFTRSIYTDEELNRFLSNEPHLVGPSGLIFMIFRNNPAVQAKFSGFTTHRNLECRMASFEYNRARANNVKFEFYIPTENFFNDSRVTIFSAKDTATGIEAAATGTATGAANGTAPYEASFTIDYFNIESFEANNTHQMEQIEYDFNLPQASGCSEFLPAIYPAIRTKSFQIDYTQRSATTSGKITLAYDSLHNYLRREIYGQSVSIWDLNQNLLYHTKTSADSKLVSRENNSTTVELLTCSVLDVNSSKLGPYVRPNNEVGTSVDVTSFFGASMVSFIGHAKVRDLKCTIFETILMEPPKIFGLNTETIARIMGKFDYIVQYYLYSTDPIDVDPKLMVILSNRFWPLQVKLYKRHIETGETFLLDQLDVSDFHWDLLGWSTKPSELFMASQCFDDESEQVHVELALDIDQLANDDDRKLLAHNKFKMENDLLNDLARAFSISRLHVVEFELNFRPYDVLVSMVVADRKDDKTLTYYGEGELPQPDSYLNNRVVLENVGEQTCITTASLIRDISLVIYCPYRESAKKSTCTAIFGEFGPTIRNTKPSADAADLMATNQACQVYRYSPGFDPKPETTKWQSWKKILRDYVVKFTVERPKDRVPFTYTGVVHDYDVWRQVELVQISHYKYSLEDSVGDEAKEANAGAAAAAATKTPKVRHFDSISYENSNDCSRLCDLDTSCRSYSYCDSTAKQPANQRCLLSSLDIRASKLNDQLVKLPSISERVTVSGHKATSSSSGGSKSAPSKQDQYKLELANGCNIYERDFLGMFRLTDEVISLNRELSNQFRSEPSSFECAKWSIDLEEQHPWHHVAMFVYCANSNTCLIDENLFDELRPEAKNTTTTTTTTTATSEAKNSATTTTDNGNDNDDDNDIDWASRRDLQCSVYRRKYQTYFHISTEVFPVNPMYQVELAFGTVEECARACWNRFGQSCGSFDYCSPKQCYLNMVSNEKGWNDTEYYTTVKREIRPECLHYERDLQLDLLRKEHLIGRHQALAIDHLGTGGGGGGNGRFTFSSLLLNMILFCILATSFVAGLLVGRRVNDQMESVTILPQTFSGPSNLVRRASQALGFSWLVSQSDLMTGHLRKGSQPSNLAPESGGFENGIYEMNSSSAIQMEEIKTSVIKEEDEENVNHNGDDDDDDIYEQVTSNTNGSSSQLEANSKPTDTEPNLLSL